MAVPLTLLITLLIVSLSLADEKRLKESWSKLSNPKGVHQFYKLLGVHCVWYCEGKPTEELKTLQEILPEVVHHGLSPESYKPAVGVDPELATTDSLIRLAYHLYYGRTKPSELYGSWNLPEKPDRVIQTLANLIKERRLREFIVELSPRNPEYWFLVEQAKSLRELSKFEWKPIRMQKKPSYGEKSPCLDEIRFRLFLLGDLKEYSPSESFDDILLEAVKNFQKRHGLPETGNIDQKTIAQLNTSPEERLRQVYLNLEKHRWLPEDFKRGVLVNIPSFELFLIEGGSVRLYSKVIVGRNYKKDFRPTPLLYSRIESISVNPSWYVPVSISVKDILPKVKRDPGYLKRKGFRVFSAGGEVDPLQVDWSRYNERNFPFQLVQNPGSKNALGRLKFNFPNPFAIYLHDTPDKHLFNRASRAFSSGCIRVEKARELALMLLGDGWTFQRLDALIRSGQTQTLKLKTSTPIYILYFTAFEREGTLHFREDIYGYDTILSNALSKSGGKR